MRSSQWHAIVGVLVLERGAVNDKRNSATHAVVRWRSKVSTVLFDLARIVHFDFSSRYQMISVVVGVPGPCK